jgi:hypothetical protein
LQWWETGVKVPGKEMYLLLLSANNSGFSVSSSTSLGTQKRCWDVDLSVEIDTT